MTKASALPATAEATIHSLPGSGSRKPRSRCHRGSGDDLVLEQVMFDSSDDLGWYADPLEQGSHELGQDAFTGDQVVLDKNVAQ